MEEAAHLLIGNLWLMAGMFYKEDENLARLCFLAVGCFWVWRGVS